MRVGLMASRRKLQAGSGERPVLPPRNAFFQAEALRLGVLSRSSSQRRCRPNQTHQAELSCSEAEKLVHLSAINDGCVM